MEFASVVVIEDVTVDGESQPGYTSRGAIRCSFPDKENYIWIPKSQVDDRSEVYKSGDVGTIVISEWIANQKDLI